MVPATLRDTGGRRRCCCRWPAAERCAPRNDGRCARGCGHQLAAAAGARAPGRGDRVSLTPSRGRPKGIPSECRSPAATGGSPSTASCARPGLLGAIVRSRPRALHVP
ncbi:hypothetical protein MRX96_025041 [Rhipicephalus microplus]